MMRALWTAGSGMAAQQVNIDVISHNLANVNTNGFKKSRSDFQDLMYQTVRQAGVNAGGDTQIPTGIQIGHGVRHVATQKLYTNGSTQHTGNQLDVAIAGDGFFQVNMPDGTMAYTRDGAFKLDGEGRLVTSDGYLIEPQITVPEGSKSIFISADGIVSVSLPNNTVPQEIGQLQLVRFINPAGLESLGQNLLLETNASGVPTLSNPGEDGSGSLAQQYLEMSNVQVVEEMVNMIVAQRAYEINSKAITTSDEMLGVASNLKR